MPELDIKCNVEGGKFHYTEDGIIIAPIGLVFTLNIPIDFKLDEPSAKKLYEALCERLTNDMDVFVKDMSNTF
jgi:hypothetical protein